MENISDLISKLSEQLNKKVDDLIVEGLKRKGFVFENRNDIEKFIQSNCRCEDNIDLKKRTYFVNDTPFFLHGYEINPMIIDRELKWTANLGSYKFL